MNALSSLVAGLGLSLTLAAAPSFAAVIFSQDFESGLGGNESTGGAFVINNTGFSPGDATNTMGHARTYSDNEYSYYEIDGLLLTGTSITMTFDYFGNMETHFDRFNVLASTGAFAPPGGLLAPTGASNMQFIDHGHDHHPSLGQFAYDSSAPAGGQSGIAEFDLSAFSGQTVNLRFQFGSDGSVTTDGFNMDNVVITSDAAQVPEPATLALLGLGLAGLGFSRRKQ